MVRLRRLSLIPFLALTLAGCGTAQLTPCESSTTLRPPRNFASVVAPDGRDTGIYRGGQPARCGELEYLRSIGVRSILKLNDRAADIDSAEKERASTLGLTVRDFAFNASTIGRPETCRDVRDALAFLRNRDNRPIYVHCTAGKDRTGYIIGMYEKIDMAMPTAEVLAHLHEQGHRGARKLVMHQIDSELASDKPVCAQ